MQCVECFQLHTTGNAKCFLCRYQQCRTCKKYFEKCAFISHYPRRKKLTVNCLKCRSNTSYTQRFSSSKSATCRQYYIDWQKQSSCVKCGATDVIQADHIDPKLKTHSCSDYIFWSRKGGLQALKSELQKCQALCIMCHRLKTKHDNELTRTFFRPCRTKRYDLINSEKLKRKFCHHCQLEVNFDNTVCFDFDHREEKNKLCSISDFVSKNQTYFDDNFQKELSKCDLLCARCHHKKTHQ